MAVSTRLKLSLNKIETQCLQLWMRQVSNSLVAGSDKTQNAMRELLEKIEHEIKVQQPEWDCKYDYGDF
jgi:hypothetical protein